MHKPTLLVAVALAVSTFACGGIRVVRRTPHGGTIALQGMRDEAQKKASQYMTAQCPTGYDVTEEEEAVVGQQTSARTTDTKHGSFTSASSSDVREWRVTFRCKDAPPEAGGPEPRPQALKTFTVRF